MPVLIVAGIAEHLLRRPLNNYRIKHDFIEAEGNKIEGLILGNSSTLYGVNPAYFKKHNVYNLAHVSQTTNLDLALFNHYLENLSQLKFVIISLSYTSLREQLQYSNEAWRIKNYLLYHKLPLEAPWRYRFELTSASVKENLYWLNQHYGRQTPLFRVDEQGWGTSFSNIVEPQKFHDAATATARWHTLAETTLVEENKAAYHRLIQASQARNIKVIALTTPTRPEYSEKLDRNQLEEAVVFGQELEQEYDNCKYLNLLKDTSYTPYDFYDPNHLNPNGAAKLSSKLSIVINSLIPQSKQNSYPER
jgi:hypothetical protein